MNLKGSLLNIQALKNMMSRDLFCYVKHVVVKKYLQFIILLQYYLHFDIRNTAKENHMKNLSVIDKIKSKEFRGNQRIIAKKIITEFHKMAFLSGAEMARECSVSISAITRFAQKMGYKGFPEFKRALEDIYRERITPYEMFEGFIKKSETTIHEKGFHKI